MPSKHTPKKSARAPILAEPTPVPSEEGLTKAERLEREYWSLQYQFQDFIKDDLPLATQWLRWAVDLWGQNTKDIRGEKE